MDRHLVYVHGICKHEPGYSDSWWTALAPHVSFPGERGAGRREVLWSDLTMTASEAPLTALKMKTTLLDRLDRDLQSAVVQSYAMARNPRSVTIEPHFDLSWMECIGDFVNYIVNDAIRRRVIDRFCQEVLPLLKDGHRVDVIAHSWGTVVAYEALRQLSDEDEPLLPDGVVVNLFTVGSALSIPTVRASIYYRYGKKPRLVGRWLNLNARGDLVGGRMKSNPYEVDEEFLNLEPANCGMQHGVYDPIGAHLSYFSQDNLVVNRDIFGKFLME